jgi:hypothetical protein
MKIGAAEVVLKPRGEGRTLQHDDRARHMAGPPEVQITREVCLAGARALEVLGRGKRRWIRAATTAVTLRTHRRDKHRDEGRLRGADDGGIGRRCIGHGRIRCDAHCRGSREFVLLHWSGARARLRMTPRRRTQPPREQQDQGGQKGRPNEGAQCMASGVHVPLGCTPKLRRADAKRLNNS